LNFVQAYGRVSLFWLWLYAYGILYNLAFIDNNINALFIECVADLYKVKTVDNFQPEIRIPNVCKSNSSLKFKTKVRKFELCLTSLISIIITFWNSLICKEPKGWNIFIIIMQQYLFIVSMLCNCMLQYNKMHLLTFILLQHLFYFIAHETRFAKNKNAAIVLYKSLILLQDWFHVQ